MERLFIFSVSVLCFFFSLNIQAQTCSVKSPAHRVALLELYTSEGCSSCPPADQWLSRLAAEGLDATKVVPLSLHVDYWNYIGWKDPYSSAQYTSRQREIAAQNRLGTIYTPQLVLQGKDFRSWRRVDFSALLQAINKQPANADIELGITAQGQGVFALKADAVLRDAARYTGARLLVAVVESGLRSNVAAGENRGRLLRHDYVVRRLFAPERLSAAGKAGFATQLALPSDWDSTRLGLVAFVEHPVEGTLQAISTPLGCKQ